VVASEAHQDTEVGCSLQAGGGYDKIPGRRVKEIQGRSRNSDSDSDNEYSIYYLRRGSSAVVEGRDGKCHKKEGALEQSKRRGECA